MIEVQRGDNYSVRCLYGARTVSDRRKTEGVKCLGASCAEALIPYAGIIFSIICLEKHNPKGKALSSISSII